MPRPARSSEGFALARLHADERGVTSVMSLVAVLVFTILLVMLTNVVRHVDDKVRMQNAADATAYSAGAVLARGLNSIALANRVQSDTLALVALLQALEQNGDRTGQPLQPLLLLVLGSPDSVEFPPGDRLIENYQRDLLWSVPEAAREAALEIAARHGLPRGQLLPGAGQARFEADSQSGPRGPIVGVLWRTPGLEVGQINEFDPRERTLPILDPNADGPDLLLLPDPDDALERARRSRREAAGAALEAWMDVCSASGILIDRDVRRDAAAALDELLDVRHRHSNLPFLLRSTPERGAAGNLALQWDYSLLGVAYRQFDREHGPRMFRNPVADQSDALAFAQVRLFLPRPRYRCCPWVFETEHGPVLHTDPWSRDWDSFNPMWSVQLMPADAEAALAVLQSAPSAGGAGFRPLRLDNVLPQDIERINTH
ncbi:MAG: hypothetical protein KF774_11860 [Planctomyces sp.]|nr:hypothetical protein [Planctomyces sp.]